MAHTLSAREAFELHKSAVTRDFIAKPRLGKFHIYFNPLTFCMYFIETQDVLKHMIRLPYCYWCERSSCYFGQCQSKWLYGMNPYKGCTFPILKHTVLIRVFF